VADKKIRTVARQGYDIFFIIAAAFSAVSFFTHGLITGSSLVAAIAVLWFVYKTVASRRKREIIAYIENLRKTINSAGDAIIADLPLPAVLVKIPGGEVIWGNEGFNKLAEKYENIDNLTVADIFDGFDAGSLSMPEDNNTREIIAQYENRTFRVKLMRSRSPEYPDCAVLIFTDICAEVKLTQELKLTRPVVALIQVDNYEELTGEMSSNESTFMMANIEKCIINLAELTHAVNLKNDERYTMIFEERYLPDCVKSRFDILDEVRKIKTPSGMSATLSIGIGCENESAAENLESARLAMDMALSRGGDQAVIKNLQTYEFFGGGTREVEKRTKVRTRVISSTASELIKSAPLVIAMGHKYSDMDSMGSCVGIACLCRKLGVPVKIIYDSRSTSAAVLRDKMRELRHYQDVFISNDRAMELITPETLLIITDVSRPGFVDAPRVLAAAQKIIVIDHHRRASDFISNTMVTLHEPYASSASELVAEMMQYLLLPGDILRQEAECMLAGIMLDTKNFTMKTGVRTFEAAAFLRRAGADTIEIKRLFADNMEDYFDRCDIIKTAQRYARGVAIAYSEKEVKREIAAQAADELLGIEGIQGSFVVYRFSGATHISGRSLGKVNVQIVLERMGGGGSLMEAGAQPGDRPVGDVVDELKASINAYFSAI
jgi:c-di-AMP phosphodiesterase-like protein